MDREIEDGMGFSGLIPTKEEKYLEKLEREIKELKNDNALLRVQVGLDEPAANTMALSLGYKIEKEIKILEYCRGFINYMWAAKICAIILNCEFQNVTEKRIEDAIISRRVGK